MDAEHKTKAELEQAKTEFEQIVVILQAKIQRLEAELKAFKPVERVYATRYDALTVPG